MAFPISYKNSILLGRKFETIPNLEEVIDILFNNFKQSGVEKLTKEDNVINFVGNKSLMGFSYEVKVRVFTDNDVKISYEFRLVDLLIITIALILIVAFFAEFSNRGVIILASLILVFGYIVNVAYVNNSIKKLIKSSFENVFDLDEEIITQDQKLWINDPYRCPACGNYITEDQMKCDDCGLSLKSRPKKRKSKTSYTYHYKNKSEQ